MVSIHENIKNELVPEISKVISNKALSLYTTYSTHAFSRHAATSPHNIKRGNFTE